MRGDFVALDLETTGLDPKTDAIIEFGAVRFSDGKVTAEYSTLINPGRPIPTEVTNLTGISNSDFLPKLHKPGEPAQPPPPTLAQALPAIQAFVGNAPIVGHNVGFDLSYLYPHGLFQNNIWIDTYELASVLLPRATRYSLSSLAKQLDIELTEAHRALHDARASALLYWAMWQKILALPVTLNHEIVALSEGSNWNARSVFEYALEQQRASKPKTEYGAQNTTTSAFPAFNPETSDDLPDVTTLSPADDFESVLGPEGTLSQQISDYEFRPQQLEMALKISQVFEDNQHLIIEAGTGVGKSLAYLLPAVEWATKHQSRVIISTNTLNLQDQLLESDIPLLKQVVNTPFEAAVLKGRNNYLCPVRLMEMRRRHPASVDELRVLGKVLVWLTEGGSGEKSEINLRAYAEQNAWQRLSAEAENCDLTRCEVAAQGKCPFYRARKRAEASQIVIVNHALLLADAKHNDQVIPEYDHIIIDEAHHLEEAVTNSLSLRIDETGLEHRLSHLANNPHSILNELVHNIRATVPAQHSKRLLEFLDNFQSATSAVVKHLANLFTSLRDLCYRPDAEGPIVLRITPEVRVKPEFSNFERQWVIVEEFLTTITDGLQRLIPALARLKDYAVANLEDDISSLDEHVIYFTQITKTVEELIRGTDSNTIYWIHLNPSYGASINTAPLAVGNLINLYLWSAKQAVVLTSATLTTNGDFDYVLNTFHAESIETLALDSPFDYRQSTLVFIPNDIADPNERGRYQQAVENALIEVAAALGGRTLALFTSYTQLQQTAQAIRPRLALGDITVYDQLDSSNRQTLLESFKSTEKAILLGTRSFWEGVDIPGARLSALALTKLPFPIPTDPIISARSERFKDPFKEYMLPETILRFRQGFGRLIRKQSDRGIVVLLDRRVMSKSYGQDFLDSLPDCTIQYGSLDSLGTAAQKWIG